MFSKISRIVKSLSFFYVLAGLSILFVLLAKAHGGYVGDRQRLGILIDVCLSAGAFLVGLPLLVQLLLPGTRQPLLASLSRWFQISAGLLLFVFVFAIENTTYIGFAQLPEGGQKLFLSVELISILGALFYILSAVVQNRLSSESKTVVPVVLLFVSCGVGLGVWVLQLMTFLFPEYPLYEALVPLSDFLRQAIVCCAVSTVISFLVTKNKSLNVGLWQVCNGISTVFVLMGFLSTATRTQTSEWTFVLSLGSLSLGMAGWFALVSLEMWREWRASALEIIGDGRWVSRMVFLSALVLLAIVQSVPGRMILSNGIVDNLVFSFLVFGVPFLLNCREIGDRLNSKFNETLVSTLSWCGFSVVVISILVLAPNGASVTTMSNASFQPFFGIAITGAFMLAASLWIVVWDRILWEFV